MTSEHRVRFKVYYEDTDSLGVVYYANYLKFLERGRTEYVNQFGRDVQVWNAEGYYFVVYALNMRFRKAAELGDWLEIISTHTLTSPYRAQFQQRIERNNGEVVVEAEIELVCLGPNRSVREFPSFGGV